MDLAGLERQLRLKAGETVEPPGDDGEKRPSDAYLNTPMVCWDCILIVLMALFSAFRF